MNNVVTYLNRCSYIYVISKSCTHTCNIKLNIDEFTLEYEIRICLQSGKSCHLFFRHSFVYMDQCLHSEFACLACTILTKKLLIR